MTNSQKGHLNSFLDDKTKGWNTAPLSIWSVVTSVATRIPHGEKDDEKERSGKDANKCSIRDRPVFPGMRLSVHFLSAALTRVTLLLWFLRNVLWLTADKKVFIWTRAHRAARPRCVDLTCCTSFCCSGSPIKRRLRTNQSCQR